VPDTVPPTTAPETTTTPTVLGVEVKPETAAVPKAAPAVPAAQNRRRTAVTPSPCRRRRWDRAAGVLLVAVRRLPRSS
jgi:hypothetical protein